MCFTECHFQKRYGAFQSQLINIVKWYTSYSFPKFHNAHGPSTVSESFSLYKINSEFPKHSLTWSYLFLYWNLLIIYVPGASGSKLILPLTSTPWAFSVVHLHPLIYPNPFIHSFVFIVGLDVGNKNNIVIWVLSSRFYTLIEEIVT